MFHALQLFACQHEKGFKHAEIVGKETAKTAFYLSKLWRAMLASLFGWYECAPALPVVACSPAASHRELAEAISTPVECACAPPATLPQIAIRVCGAVTKLLDFNETRHNPKAIAAVREEVEALAACGTWGQHPYERDDIVRWAQNHNITVHVGEGLGICSIKNSEMQECHCTR